MLGRSGNEHSTWESPQEPRAPREDASNETTWRQVPGALGLCFRPSKSSTNRQETWLIYPFPLPFSERYWLAGKMTGWKVEVARTQMIWWLEYPKNWAGVSVLSHFPAASTAVPLFLTVKVSGVSAHVCSLQCSSISFLACPTLLVQQETPQCPPETRTFANLKRPECFDSDFLFYRQGSEEWESYTPCQR